MARTQYDAVEFGAVTATLDPLIATLEPQAPKDPAAAKLLAAAFELRARARFQLQNSDGATADFRALLKIAPGHTFAEKDKVGPRVKAMLEEVRKTTVGRILLTLTAPEGAEFELDGLPFTPMAGPIPMAVGSHTLSGRRAGCRPVSIPFSVLPNAETQVVITLERVAASISLITSPPGVDIQVDGMSRGRTEVGPPPSRWDGVVAKAGLQAAAVSKPLVIDDLGIGTHVITASRECHKRTEREVNVDRLGDFIVEPIKLEKAVASVYIDSPGSGAMIVVDNEQRGRVPQSLDDICEGSHTVELKSQWGRYIERLNVNAGDKLNVEGTLKPAVALLSVTGRPRDFRGPDPRLDIEKGLSATKSLTLFGPAEEKVQQALSDQKNLSPGWLAFDRRRRPVGDTANNIRPAARREIGSSLARTFDVQGVAELAATPGSDRPEFLLTILAADSSVPDVLDVALDSMQSVNGVILKLDKVPEMYRPTAGLTVADVLDVTGAVVVSADPAAKVAGLTPGDIITKVGGQPVKDGSEFMAIVARRKKGDTLTVEVLGKGGTPRPATLTVTMAPRLIRMNDQSLLFNTLVLVLRTRLAVAGNSADPIVRLNLAVALMRLASFDAARMELLKVQLPAGPGVSNGTVQFLLGWCYESLNQIPEAEKAWRAAATDPESQLHEDGPFIRELVEQRLAGLKK